MSNKPRDHLPPEGMQLRDSESIVLYMFPSDRVDEVTLSKLKVFALFAIAIAALILIQSTDLCSDLDRFQKNI